MGKGGRGLFKETYPDLLLLGSPEARGLVISPTDAATKQAAIKDESMTLCAGDCMVSQCA